MGVLVLRDISKCFSVYGGFKQLEKVFIVRKVVVSSKCFGEAIWDMT